MSLTEGLSTACGIKILQRPTGLIQQRCMQNIYDEFEKPARPNDSGHSDWEFALDDEEETQEDEEEEEHEHEDTGVEEDM